MSGDRTGNGSASNRFAAVAGPDIIGNALKKLFNNYRFSHFNRLFNSQQTINDPCQRVVPLLGEMQAVHRCTF